MNQSLAQNDNFYTIGKSDAEAGLLCVPEFYATTKRNVISYVLGYLSSKNSETAEWFLNQAQVTI